MHYHCIAHGGQRHEVFSVEMQPCSWINAAHLPEEVLVLKLLILVKVNSSEFLLPLESLVITITLHMKG